jgi:hypothetical protein
MRGCKKHRWWSVVCIMAAFLEADAAGAATLGSGKGWQAPWEAVTAGSLTLSVNATGGASLGTADGWTLNLPEIWFIFHGIGYAHSPPSGGRPGKEEGAWEELRGTKTDAGEDKQITTSGLTEGIALRRRVAISGNTVSMDWKGLGVLPSKDIENLSVQMNLARRSPQAAMPFVAETNSGRTFSGDLCKVFSPITGLTRLRFTSGAHTVQIEFTDEGGEGWALRNYGNPEKTAYPVVAGIGMRSQSLQQLRKVNGTWHSRVSVSLR